jgi:hypothetical protein
MHTMYSVFSYTQQNRVTQPINGGGQSSVPLSTRAPSRKNIFK